MTLLTPTLFIPNTTQQELDLTKVYVIGGIVDRTIVRGVTVKEAGALGVRTARLPLEYLNVRTKCIPGRFLIYPFYLTDPWTTPTTRS